MANDNKDWSASAQLNEMKKNPLFNRLRAQSTVDTGRYGNLQQDVINYNKMSLGRESLNKFGNSQKGLYTPGSDNIGPMVNRRRDTSNLRSGAAMGTNSEWALPKLHDPFEFFRERSYWFSMEDPDEQTRKIRDWSASPDSLVLMGDYTWKRIGDISEGEEVIGWEPYATKNSIKQRLVKTKVVALKHRIAPNTVKVTMESGRTMVVTDDHMWANYNYSPSEVSRRDKQRNVIKEQENQRISASELFEIGFTSGQVARKMGIKVSAAEKWHSIWAKDGMDNLSSIDVLTLEEDECAEYVTSHVGAELKFITKPPTHLVTDGRKFSARDLSETVDYIKGMINVAVMLNDGEFIGSREKIVSVETLGEGPVVSMQTGTGNYIQDGYASKNCRLIYTTHYLVPSMIDIYSRFPLLGMEFAHPDKRVNEFFSELFWDGLQYQDFLYDLSREHWLIGDVFALGSWNDGLGAFEADELINPNDVVVAKNRALRTYQYHIKVPEEVKKLVETRQPEKEYAMLMAMYPDVVEYARKDVEIPVSDVLMKGIPQKTNPWAEHGTPLLMRAFRQLMMEESLMASMEAISDRLYSPLILATLGLPDADGDGPWVPDAEELGALRDDLAMAINSDFRLICQPPGTIVTKVVNHRGNYGEGGCKEPEYEYVPIETLEKGDRVLSYDIGTRRIVKFGNLITEIGTRDFDGELICVDSDGSKSRYTPDHICLVKLGETFNNKHSVYVMRKGNQFRVGTNGPNPNRKNGMPGEYAGPKHRFKNEKFAEDMWILDTFDTAQEARMVENLVSYKYGLPQVQFSYNGQNRSSTEIIPEKFWEFYGDNYDSGITALEAYGKDINLPLFTKTPGQITIGEGRLNYNEILRVRAVNLLPGMEVFKTDGASWSPIKISREYYQGLVWSMDVEKHHTYVADGLVTHNCYHHGLEIQNAFGRESMPRLDDDFYRIQGNYMMVFGIGSELLQGGKSGATYASGALNRELITQMLTTHQHQIKHFIQSRMRAVAERQGFYEYRNVGGHPVPIMETVLVVDEETGAQFVEERPKLAIPDIIFQSMSLQDENVERQFLQQLAGMGLPVSFQTFTRNAGIDFEDELETRKKEKVDLVIAEQQVKKDIFDRCFQLQLPIPMEYQSEYEAYIMQLQDPQLAAQLRPGAIQDLSAFTPTPNISGAPVHVDAGGIPDMYPSIANQETLDANQQKKHPPESHEQKKTQPKKSKAGKPNGPQKKTASVEDGEMLVTSKKTGEDIIIKEGEVVSNIGVEGGEWGKFRKSNPKQASVTEEFSGDKEVTYGDRMKFSVPWESQYRVQMKMAAGMKIVVDDNYEKYDETYMKNHIAKILEANVVTKDDNDFDDKLNEAIIPTNMDFDKHKSDMMGFDMPAVTGVNPEDMGPKVTFGSKEFPNRKNVNKDK